MAAYQPLRDAFREWNRMIIDGQRFDKQHELNQADQRMKERQFESQLGLQEFNMKMTGARHELAKRGEERAADGLALRQQIHTDSMTQQAYNNKRNTRKDKLAEEVHDVRLKTLQDQQIMTEIAAEDALHESATVQLDFAQTFGNEIFKDPEKLASLNEVANSRGYNIGPDGLAYDANGDGYPIKRKFQKDEIPWILGRMMEDEDPHLETAQRIGTINDSKKELQDSIKDAGTSGHTMSERAAMKREVNKLNGEIAREEQFFTDPATQATHYNKKADLLRGAARSIAAGGDTAYATTLVNEANDYAARVKALQHKGTGIQLYDRNKGGEGIGMASYNSATGTWKYDGVDYQSLRDIPGVDATTLDIAARGAAARKAGQGGKDKGMTYTDMFNQIRKEHSTFSPDMGFVFNDRARPRNRAATEYAMKLSKEQGLDVETATNSALSFAQQLDDQYLSDRARYKSIPKGGEGMAHLKAEMAEFKKMGIKSQLDPKTVRSFKAVKREVMRMQNVLVKAMQRSKGIKNPYIPDQEIADMMRAKYRQ